MPFGRYRNIEVSALPADYLRWLATLDLREPLAAEVKRVLDDAGTLSSSSSALPAELRPTVQEIIAVGYRMLSLRAHPDRSGGKHQDMVKLNAARDWLKRLAA